MVLFVCDVAMGHFFRNCEFDANSVCFLEPVVVTNSNHPRYIKSLAILTR